MNVNFLSRPEARSIFLEGTDHFVFTMATVVDIYFSIIIVWDLRAGQFFFEGMDPLVCITGSANKAFATSQLVDVCWFARISMK